MLNFSLRKKIRVGFIQTYIFRSILFKVEFWNFPFASRRISIFRHSSRLSPSPSMATPYLLIPANTFLPRQTLVEASIKLPTHKLQLLWRPQSLSGEWHLLSPLGSAVPSAQLPLLLLRRARSIPTLSWRDPRTSMTGMSVSTAALIALFPVAGNRASCQVVHSCFTSHISFRDLPASDAGTVCPVHQELAND